MAEGYCAFCNGSLRWKEATARFCSPTCRVGSYRKDGHAQAEAVIEAVMPMRESASILASAGAFDDPRGATWQARAERAVRTMPLASRRFGSAAIWAAARTLDAEHRGQPTTCRWCHCRAYAGRLGVEIPTVDAASRKILGTPCRRCLVAIRESLTARVDVARAENVARNRRASSWSRTASAVPRDDESLADRRLQLKHGPANCLTCHRVFSGESRPALTAAAIAPHRPERQVRSFWIRGCPCFRCTKLAAEHNSK